MKNRLQTFKNKISADRFFFRSFLQIFLLMAVIFSLFALYTYHNSRQILENEFTEDTKQDVQNLADSVDDTVLETEYIISTLMNNTTLRHFYNSPSPEMEFPDYSAQVKALLSALQNSKKSIEAIYLYSEASHSFYSSNSHTYIDSFDDPYWLDKLSPAKNGFSIFSYAMRDKFPYVICVAKEFTIDQKRCAIAIMIDPAMVPIVTSLNDSVHNNVYLVSDSNEIIYRYRQEALSEPLDTVEPLSVYEPDIAEKFSISTINDNTYCVAQLHSPENPWSYVVATRLQNYSARFSTQNTLLFVITSCLIIFAILISIYLTVRALKPLQNIRVFLDSPEMMSIKQISDSEDIKYIATRINHYIQTNQSLKDELQKQLAALNETQILALQLQINPHFLSNTLNLMYITATEALGYDHPLPLMILNTSSLIRYAIEPSKMVSFKTELAQTDIYLTILQQRYDQSLEIVHEIAADTLEAQVPRLFIQPIIENAVFHGFSQQRNSDCKLTIRSYRQPKLDSLATEFVVIQVQDNGNGISQEKLEELKKSLEQENNLSAKGIGLRNIIHRMNLIYSNKFSLNIESTLGKGTCFTLTFPYYSSANSSAAPDVNDIVSVSNR